MTWLDKIPDPTDAELWVIELRGQVLSVELALLDAEEAFFGRPSSHAAARYLSALLDVVDHRDMDASPRLDPSVLEAMR